MAACKSYRLGERLCSDGFPTTTLCSGKGKCWGCGAIPASAVPLCMGDEMPNHLIMDDGYPQYATPAGRAALSQREGE